MNIIDLKNVLKAILCFTIGFLFGFFARNKMNLEQILGFLFKAGFGICLMSLFLAFACTVSYLTIYETIRFIKGKY